MSAAPYETLVTLELLARRAARLAREAERLEDDIAMVIVTLGLPQPVEPRQLAELNEALALDADFREAELAE